MIHGDLITNRSGSVEDSFDPALGARLFKTLLLIRRTEERIAAVYPTDCIKSPVHLSIGQEAVAVGVCDALSRTDVVAMSYRGHAVYLAKGGDLRKMIAELYGKVTGCARGKGGSMHLVAPEVGVLGASAVVATQIPIATGWALAAKKRAAGQVVACFFGDGATEEGCMAESLNFAALHHLPILFICENNGYAIHEPLAKRWATTRLCERVATYGIATHRIEDQDVFAIRNAAQDALASIREGAGPAFIECLTYRWREHVGPSEDYESGYRGAEELHPWRASDQVERLARMLPDDRVHRISQDVAAQIDDAFNFAVAGDPPDADELWRHVYASRV
jgi:TPP-dependent pyruvate/acetoin dehydrogenase alpha subunit